MVDSDGHPCCFAPSSRIDREDVGSPAPLFWKSATSAVDDHHKPPPLIVKKSMECLFLGQSASQIPHSTDRFCTAKPASATPNFARFSRQTAPVCFVVNCFHEKCCELLQMKASLEYGVSRRVLIGGATLPARVAFSSRCEQSRERRFRFRWCLPRDRDVRRVPQSVWRHPDRWTGSPRIPNSKQAPPQVICR